ncbi:hypothetical protein IC006_2100 [Sulfuracidifex tepidarius]|uniref:Uncharacterized protein n=1 Tax=Sulfuracidifex tepidarius TaxID=1294262 RepID=A0A510DX15_9CREN|nr:hypothetical protein [Sulfuracidifex tepidarius]BBG24766.1 hypothetical protein IC006_2100 [Sulfuracidifex tepidarius]
MSKECREIRKCVEALSSGQRCSAIGMKLLRDLGVVKDNQLFSAYELVFCETDLTVQINSEGDTTRTFTTVAIPLRRIETRERSFHYVKFSEDVIKNVIDSINIQIKSRIRKNYTVERKILNLKDESVLIKLNFRYSPPLEAGDVEEYLYTKTDIHLHRVFRDDDEEDTEEVEAIRISYPTWYARIHIRFPPTYPLNPSPHVKGSFSSSSTMNLADNYIDMDIPVKVDKSPDYVALTSEIYKPHFPASYAITWLIPSRDQFYNSMKRGT